MRCFHSALNATVTVLTSRVVQRVVVAGRRVLVIGEVVRAARGSARPLADVRQGYAAPLAA